ncbi:response regulator [Halorubellus salinus]|uniref:response regulator n=1 Tax=Halorubellus salinus TaxID=755309 RepID=UPI001D08AC36|nr:response regulator [Halorubellus salinus]
MVEQQTVLHLDDDEAFLDLAERFLEREGLDVRTYVDPDAALSALEDVECVVCDYDMPACTGLEFLERVRDRDSDVPFVLFTGKGSETVASTAISAGVSDYVQKGGADSWTLLANRVDRAVSEYRAQRELRERADRFEAIFEDHASPMLLVDPDTGRIERANRAACEFYGYDADAFTERSVDDVNALPPDEVADCRAAADAGDENHFEFEHELADGEVRAVDVHSTPISVGGDDVLFSIVHDASDRER